MRKDKHGRPLLVLTVGEDGIEFQKRPARESLFSYIQLLEELYKKYPFIDDYEENCSHVADNIGLIIQENQLLREAEDLSLVKQVLYKLQVPEKYYINFKKEEAQP
jgi:hypothetical protein